MNIASWNVNSLRVRLPHVLQWLEQANPDVLCLQELKMQDSEFPHDEFEKAGYHSVCHGQKTYNGVAIISKKELENVTKNAPFNDDPQCRYIAGIIDNHCIVNVYVPNGQALDSDKFIYKRDWLEKLRLHMQALLMEYPATTLVGDFNITPSDLDVHAPEKWRGKIHCSNIERLILQKLMATGLYDTYRHFNHEPDNFSWWDYRGGGYDRNEGLRIDLILSSSKMLSEAKNCYIDEAPRKLERPSDHTPVVVEYQTS